MAHHRTAVPAGRPALNLLAYAVLLSALAMPVAMASQFGLAPLASAFVPATAAAAVSLAWLSWVGRRLPDRWSLVFGLSWGAALAALVGLYLVQRIYAGQAWSMARAVVFAPLVEETLKLLALVVVAVALTTTERRRSGRLSVFLAAAASGVGFAFTENLTYFAMWSAQAPAQMQDPVATTVAFLTTRAPVACLGHPLFTGLGAAVVALGLHLPARRRLGYVLAGFAVAAGTHGVWNLIAELTNSVLLLTAYGVLLLAVAVPVAVRLRRSPAVAGAPVPQPAEAASGTPMEIESAPATPPWLRLDVDDSPASAANAALTTASAEATATAQTPGPGAPAQAAERHVRMLLQHGRTADACLFAERLLARRRNPADAALLQVLRLATVAALPDPSPDDVDRAIAEARSALADHPAPRLLGRFHTSVGSLCLTRGETEEALRHLLDAASALRGAPATPGMAEAWYELAAAHSRADLHSQAMDAYWRSRRLAASGGDPYAPGGFVPVRLALSRDHRGDTDGCVRGLRTVVAELGHQRREGEPPVPPLDLLWYGYAAARLAALGELSEVEPAPLLEAGGNEDANRLLRQAGTACLAIAAGQHVEALAILSRIETSEEPLGAPELPRLRALAHRAEGALDAAYAAEREATRLTAHTLTRLREGLLAAAAARTVEPAEHLGHVEPRFLDQVTGLPDRSFLERCLERACESGGALGMIHVHGVERHPAAGLLLRRAAAAISHALRRGDVIGRYAEDRLAVVLRETGLITAERVGRRMLGAVADEDWEALVPGAEVSIDIGWAALNPSLDVTEAIAHANESLRRASAAVTPLRRAYPPA